MRRLSGKYLGDVLRRRFSTAQRFAIVCVLAGLMCGFAAVGFHKSIEWVFEHVWALAVRSGPWFYGVLLLAPTLGGLLVGLLTRFGNPNAAGSGIPQTKAAYYNDFGSISVKDGLWRFALGVISIGSGNSLGREGPTVHLCSALSSALGRFFGVTRLRVQALVPVGMGAGIAAAFNAPLSAITFVFEELLQDFSTKALGGIVLAVVTAAAVSRVLLGEDPILTIKLPDEFQTTWWMLVALPLGGVAGVLGCLFVWLLLRLRAWAKTLTQLPNVLKPALGGLATGLLGVSAWFLIGLWGTPQGGVFSIGYESLRAAFSVELLAGSLLVLLVFKFVAVLMCYAFGGSGGLFSPTLFLGGMLGGLFGLGLVHFGLMGVSEADAVAGACVLLGMGAMFAAVIRCPMTSLLIIFEMTRNYALILPLMGGNIIAYYLARRWQPLPLYEALLQQDGIQLKKPSVYRAGVDVHQMPVAAVMCHVVESVDVRLSCTEILNNIQQPHRAYAVLGHHAALVGMVTHQELVARSGSSEPLEVFLKEQTLVSVCPEDSLRFAAMTMVKSDVGQLPVVASVKSSRLIGIITLHDIARQQNAAEGEIA